MLTVHRPSFPTCLFHPRRIHLLCHLDSPSTANLPCLGLQEQAGPEVSELCGSYRGSFQESSPSFAHSLTWRESLTSQQPVLPTSITSLTWRERCTTGQQDPTQSSTAWSQQLTGKTNTSFPTGSTMDGHFYFPIRQHRIDSRSGCRGCVTNNPRRVNTGSNCSERGGTDYLRSQPKLFGFQGCTRVFFCRGPIVYLQTVR
jgi:hypothetical protein